MTLITDAKKMLDDCQRIEESIYDLVYYTGSDNVSKLQYHIDHLPEIKKECNRMLHALLVHNDSPKILKLRKDYRYMMMRLDAAIMYVKELFKFD